VFKRFVLFLVFALVPLISASAQVDVFNMGGTRDPATGTWTGLASVEFVTVGDAGNTSDTAVMTAGYMPDRTTGYGSVEHLYQIGKYDVTAGQYCQFLNAVAATDIYGLYHTSMDYDAHPTYKGCNIKRNGVSGSYTYSVAADWANRPVNWVSWGDAARFCNWQIGRAHV
jgi:hypothetical protein